MEEEGGGHRYEVLSPTKHSKGKKTNRRTVVLTVAVAATVTSVIVIIATVMVTSLATKDTADKSFLAVEANEKIKEVRNASEVCSHFNNESVCYYAAEMLAAEDCSALQCKSYSWKIQIADGKLEAHYAEGENLKVVDTDGIPCSDSKFCYKKHCVPAKESFNIKEIRESTNKGNWEPLVGNKLKCIQMSLDSNQKARLDSITKTPTDCNHPSGNALQLRFYSCTRPQPHGVSRPCDGVPLAKNLRKWNKPFMFLRQKDCGDSEKSVEGEVGKLDKCNTQPCSVYCDTKEVDTSLLRCRVEGRITDYGYCYARVCVPEKGLNE